MNLKYLTLSLTLLSLISCTEELIKDPPEPVVLPFVIKPIIRQQISTDHRILQIDSGGHKARIRDITFTSDGRYLVSAGDDKIIRVWDLETGYTVRTLRGQIGAGLEGKINAMALSPDQRWLAVGGMFHKSNNLKGSVIRLYNFSTGKLVTLLKGHRNAIYGIAFSPNSRYLVSGQGGNYHQFAIVWDINKKQPLQILKGHIDRIYAVAFTPDSKRVVTGSDDHSLRLWRVADGKLIAKLQGHSDKVRSVAISPDGTIASGSKDNSIRLWNGKTGRFIKILATQRTQVGSLSFSPNGDYLVSGVSSSPHNCHIWSYPSGKEIVIYKKHDNIVLATAVSPDERWVATAGGNDQAIHIWNQRDGSTLKQLQGVGATIWAVGFSKDGKHMAWGVVTASKYL